MLDGKVIIVTGGSKGLGLATCKALIEMGAKVGILARSQEAIDVAVDTLGVDKAVGFAVDVADRASIEQAFFDVESYFGRLDGLVNNAGLARVNKIETMPIEDLALQVNTNFIGLVYCCQVAIPLLRKHGGGRIINISSASVHHENEMSHLSIYAATKAAVETFSRELRNEVTEDKIGVTVLVPGMADSEFGAGFDMEKLSVALHAWQDRGKYFDGSMDAADVGKAVAHCFTYPEGVSVDFLEVKPHKPAEKPIF